MRKKINALFQAILVVLPKFIIKVENGILYFYRKKIVKIEHCFFPRVSCVNSDSINFHFLAYALFIPCGL